jgi:HD-GYP domain-containing protein (c-di-GMP phosphodiesterase class II)
MDLLDDSAPDVAAHADRTARLARLVGLELGLTGAELQLVFQTARLHDVGKVALPPWVLQKPDPLSDTESAMVRRLPLISQTIVERKPALVHLGPLVRATHERWDGRGYPDGLEGSEIPRAARVTAVCDAFDAMTTARPHSPPLSIDRAIGELRRCAGTHFDPDAAGTLRRLLGSHIDRWAQGA